MNQPSVQLGQQMLSFYCSEAYALLPELFKPQSHRIEQRTQEWFRTQNLQNDLELTDAFYRIFYEQLVGTPTAQQVQQLDRLYKHVYRTSRYGKLYYGLMLTNLLSDKMIENIANVYVPACGLFYESDITVKLLNAKSIVANDINKENLSFSKSLSTKKDVTFVHQDLTKTPLDGLKTADLVLSIHPEVADWDAFKTKAVYQDTAVANTAPQTVEAKRPIEALKTESKSCMNTMWKSIFENIYNGMKPGALCVVICYEERDQDILKYFLNKNSYGEIISEFTQFALPEVRFIPRFIRPAEDDIVESMLYTTMQNYRTGLLLQKTA